MTLVVALGGNAILPKDADGTVAEARQAISETVAALRPLLEQEQVAVTHGNGPQVGTLLLEQERTPAIPELPLDVLVAETQSQIGYLLQQAIQNQIGKDAATVTTQVVVDGDDAAFDEPTKPVGPWYTEAEAAEQPFVTKQVGSGEQAYRRVVPSPAPQRIVESDMIEQLLDTGTVPVACGGGGIPVVDDDGLTGVEAVIDKDRASTLLADTLNADELVLLTNVPYAYRNYGTDDEEPIEEITADELEGLLEAGAFGEGSMQPKVEACVSFIRNGGQRAIITDPDNVRDAVAGDAGTQVNPA